MNTVTIPPAKPEIETSYANPVLVRNPKFSECSAGQVLTNLWQDGLGKDDLLVAVGNLKFHLSVIEEGAARYHFQSADGRSAYLNVFKDFSALIHEDLGDDLRYVCANPLRLGRTHRSQQGTQDPLKILARKNMGSLHHEVRQPANSQMFRGLRLSPYSGGCKEGQRVDQLHAQMLAEARWWLTNSPKPTTDTPPIGARFNFSTEQDRAFLKEVAKVGIKASFTQRREIESGKQISVHVDCPRPMPPSGKPGPFRVEASMSDKQYFQGHPLPGINHVSDDITAKFVRRAVTSHPQINPIDYLGQRPEMRGPSDPKFVFIPNIEVPSSHEAMEAYRQILDWESS